MSTGRYYKGKPIVARYRNGKIVVARFRRGHPVYSELTDYEPLSYAESSGTQFIKLKTQGSNNINTFIEFAMNADTTGDNRFFGVYQTTTGNVIRYEAMWTSTLANGRLRIGNGTSDGLYIDITLEEMSSTFHTLDFNRQGMTYFDDAEVGAFNAGSVVSDGTIGLYSRLSPTGTAAGIAKMKIKRAYVKDNTTGEILENLIPVRRLGDDVVCFRDTISGDWYENQGSGVFVGVV